MLEKFRVGNLQAKPGETKFGAIATVEMAEGTRINVPLILINGKAEGPIIFLQAVAHGGEIIGAEVVREITREKVDPEKLNGAIIAVPIANPPAFQTGRRCALQDDANLCGVFPGKEDGSMTERIAHAIWHQAILESNYVIDIHGNNGPSKPFVLLNLTGGDEGTRAKAEKLAEAFGLTVVYTPPSSGISEGMGGAGTTRELIPLLMEKRIPSISIELVDGKRITKAAVDVGVCGVLNVMKSLHMIEGEIEKQPSDLIFGSQRLENGGMIKANRGGILHLEKEPGQFIHKDETIAYVSDAYGNKIEIVRMPFDGYIRAFAFQYHQAVVTGDTIAYLTKTV